MKRIAVIGNAGGGKSTLARRLARSLELPYHEIDAFQWRPDWSPYSEAEFEAAHETVLASDAWVLDGFGPWEAVLHRFRHADTIVLVDLPLWIHFWLAAERQMAWAKDAVAEVPAGHASPPPTRDLFEMIWRLDQEGLPRLRALVDAAEERGTAVFRLRSLEEVAAFPGEPEPNDQG